METKNMTLVCSPRNEDDVEASNEQLKKQFESFLNLQTITDFKIDVNSEVKITVNFEDHVEEEFILKIKNNLRSIAFCFEYLVYS